MVYLFPCWRQSIRQDDFFVRVCPSHIILNLTLIDFPFGLRLWWPVIRYLYFIFDFTVFIDCIQCYLFFDFLLWILILAILFVLFASVTGWWVESGLVILVMVTDLILVGLGYWGIFKEYLTSCFLQEDWVCSSSFLDTLDLYMEVRFLFQLCFKFLVEFEDVSPTFAQNLTIRNELKIKCILQ